MSKIHVLKTSTVIGGAILVAQLVLRLAPTRSPDPAYSTPDGRFAKPAVVELSEGSASGQPGAHVDPVRREQAFDCAGLEPATQEERALTSRVRRVVSPVKLFALGGEDSGAQAALAPEIGAEFESLRVDGLEDFHLECAEFACRLSVVHSSSLSARKWQEKLQASPPLRARRVRFALAGAPRPSSLDESGGKALVTEMFLAPQPGEAP